VCALCAHAPADDGRGSKGKDTMRATITKQTVDALPMGATLYDDKIAGFLARRLPSGAISFGFRYRANGKQPLLALGVLGSITATQARNLARRASGRVAAGHDPQGEKVAHRARVVNTLDHVIDTFIERPSSYAWPNKLSRIGDCGATGRRSARLARRFSTTSPILSVSSPSAKSNRQAK
jgi:hypothetical protein